MARSATIWLAPQGRWKSSRTAGPNNGRLSVIAGVWGGGYVAHNMRWLKRFFRAAARAAPKAEERDYTREELRAFDGTDASKPILLAILGDVYDVTSGSAFYGPGGPYGMFAGHDCSRALAKMSFEAVDIDGSVDDLDEDERLKLEEWQETFAGKYRKLGRLFD